jgi:hypothetical protein
VFKLARFAWLLVLAGAAGASEVTTFDLRSDPAFANAPAMLRGYARKNASARIERFCVLGVDAGGSRVAWIVWPRRNRLILWEGQDLADTPSRRELDMTRDVVNSPAELHGSSYLVTRGWLETILSRCRSVGEQITVRK